MTPRSHPTNRFSHATVHPTGKRGIGFLLGPLLLAVAAPVPFASAQIVLRESPNALYTGACSVLPGSPAVEGQPFVLELRGERGAKVILGLAGSDIGVALAGGSKPIHLVEHIWGVPVQLDATGYAQLSLNGWKAGREITLCAIGTDVLGRPCSVSSSMSVRPLPPTGTQDVVIAPAGQPGGPIRSWDVSSGGAGSPSGPSVSPTSAGVGGQIAISGPELAAISAYSAEDVRISNSAASGCLGRASAVGANSVTATITAGSPIPVKGRLNVLAGDGALVSVPPFGGMTYGNQAWGWTAASGAPSILTGTEFVNTATGVFQPCADPDMFVDLRFRVDAGMLKLKLPGTKACLGDVFSYDLAFGFSDGTKAASSHVNSSGLVASNGWAVDSLFILFPLSIALATSGSGCTALYNSASNEIFISPPSGKTITSVDGVSFLRIAFDPSQHVIVTETHGVNDNYSSANGLEATSPSAAFDAWVLNNYSIPARREYDMSGCDVYLRDTFSNYGPGAFGPVRSGNVQMHINGFGCQTYTDGIAFGWTPTPAFDWGVGLPRLEILNFAWDPGDDATLCFNLAQLPVVDASNHVTELRNILARVNDNHLDVAVQDDTTVDYITLRVLRCTTP